VKLPGPLSPCLIYLYIIIKEDREDSALEPKSVILHRRRARPKRLP